MDLINSVKSSFMILCLLAAVAVSYYVVVFSSYGPELFKGGKRLAVALPVLIVFHVLLAMLLWCYFAVVLTDPGGVPQSRRPVNDDKDMEAQTTPLLATTSAVETNWNLEELTGRDTLQHSGAFYCNRCRCYKPPRSHHCSICGRCVLKMDHHCLLVNNCIGAHNYKFFLLFLLYTFLETIVGTLALLPHLISFFKDDEQFHSVAADRATTFTALVLNVPFALILLRYIVFHTCLVARNTTTIEEKKKGAHSRRYDIGLKNNFEQVFGTKKFYWFVPIYAVEDIKSMPVGASCET